jgi:uncharacterized protein YqgV (UPF0045/DUF77 family)
MSRSPAGSGLIAGSMCYQSVMSSVRVEFMVEPFSEGSPGPHVLAAIDAARAGGVEPEVGPFGTSVEVPADSAGALVSDVVAAALAGGASRVSLQVELQGEQQGA